MIASSRLWVLLLASLLVGGCQTPPPAFVTYLAPGQEGAPGVERVLVLPMNLDTRLPEFLHDAAEASTDAMLRRLERAGRSVERLRYSSAVEAWRSSVAAVNGLSKEDGTFIPERVGFAHTEMARRLSEHHEFDVMIVSTLTIEKASAAGKFGRWDGVEERMEYVIEREASSVVRRNLVLRGATRGLSLTIRVLTREGERVFEARQGLELVDRIKLRGRYYRAEVRGDLCMDDARMDARLLDAFDPYLPRPPETSAES